MQENQDSHEHYDEGVTPPPRLLLWLVVGIFIIGIVSAVAGVVIFRSVLTPGQQERVLGVVPFMELFMPPRPEVGDTLPTPNPDESSDISPADLLSGPALNIEKTAEATIEPESTLPPTSTLAPTVVVATSTATPIPTEASIAPTAETVITTAERVYPVAARLYGFRHIKQTWNNCGPANITMGLSYFGWQEDQDVAAAFLKPDREDKNVNPWEMVAFVNEETGVRALSRIGGTTDLIKAFLANNFPVIIETGYMPEGYDWLGHYQTLVGYDDSLQVFYLYDSFLGTGENGEGISESYATMDANWQDFNRTFIVLYQQSDESVVRDILGDWADPQGAAEHALETARAEAQQNPADGFAWYNIGSSYVRLGQYTEAAAAYDQARRVGVPWRMTLYQFGPFEAYYETGRYDDVMALVNANLNNGGDYVEETYYWKGRVLAAQGQPQQAASAFRQALQHHPGYSDAQTALDALNL
ncbi:MAG: tetratricopeptide repeat protein [Anaerolineaceae bacterium]|nr:tetratricopeptide repeat protein [Anaerolineaceae bacterium]